MMKKTNDPQCNLEQEFQTFVVSYTELSLFQFLVLQDYFLAQLKRRRQVSLIFINRLYNQHITKHLQKGFSHIPLLGKRAVILN